MNAAPVTVDHRLAAWLSRRTSSSAVRRIAALSAAVASDVGMQRDQNQDRVALSRGQDKFGCTYATLVLADGMGGMRDGGWCASLALGSFLASVEDDARSGAEQESWLIRAAARANANVHREFKGAGGSTLVAVLLVAGRPAQWLSVGDSRVHLWRNSVLKQLSIDDTIAGQLKREPQGSLNSSNLLQFIGIGEQLEPHVEFIAGAEGSMILTSDGVHFIESKFLGPIVQHAPDVGMCARRLVDVAKWHGGPDNASVAVIELGAALERAPESGDIGLEVWDPFGELLLMSAPSGSVSNLTLLAPQNSTVAPASTPSPARKILNTQVARQVDDAGAKVPANSTKEKRERSNKKQKPELRKDSVSRDGEPKDPIPQLLIDFPTKGS